MRLAEGSQAQAKWSQYNQMKDVETKQRKADTQQKLFSAYNTA
jgi:hypothetical protein